MMKLCGRGFAVFAGSRVRSLLVILGLGLLGFGPMSAPMVRAQDADRGASAPSSGRRRPGRPAAREEPIRGAAAAAEGQGGASRLDPSEHRSWAG